MEEIILGLQQIGWRVKLFLDQPPRYTYTNASDSLLPSIPEIEAEETPDADRETESSVVSSHVEWP